MDKKKVIQTQTRQTYQQDQPSNLMFNKTQKKSPSNYNQSIDPRKVPFEDEIIHYLNNDEED